MKMKGAAVEQEGEPYPYGTDLCAPVADLVIPEPLKTPLTFRLSAEEIDAVLFRDNLSSPSVLKDMRQSDRCHTIVTYDEPDGPWRDLFVVNCKAGEATFYVNPASYVILEKQAQQQSYQYELQRFAGCNDQEGAAE